MSSSHESSQQLILETWFGQLNSSGMPESTRKVQRWFQSDPKFDRQLTLLFQQDIENAAKGHYHTWLSQAQPSLAFILLTDQFPRNIYRGKAQAFSFDSLALSACLQGLDAGFDETLPFSMRAFFYMPLEHSENLDHQQLCLEKFTQLAQKSAAEVQKQANSFVEYAHMHHRIIKQFGRFPHRNLVLGRSNTDAETWFLQSTQTHFGQKSFD